MSEHQTVADIVRDLPSLTDRPRCAQPKSAMKTRIDVNDDKAKIDATKLDKWRTAVYARDRLHCRVCKRKVERSIELKGNRAEAHHIVSRKNAAVRYDRRNGVTCCPRCHRDLTTHKLVIVGTASEMFQVDGVSYLNADSPTLEFVKP